MDSSWSTTASAMPSAMRCWSQVAARLRSGIREGDMLARLGGDEFMVIMHRIRGQGGRGDAGGKPAGRDLELLRGERPHAGHRRQHRHQRLSGGRNRRRGTDPAGRQRHVRRQARGQESRHLLHPRDRLPGARAVDPGAPVARSGRAAKRFPCTTSRNSN